MLNITHTIQISSASEFEVIIGILKKQYIDAPVFTVNHSDYYTVSFESNYEEYELISAIEIAFPEYEHVEGISIGVSDIRIVINQVQTHLSTDDWGRRLNTDNISSTTYFTQRPSNATQPIWQDKVVKALLGPTEEKELLVNISDGIIKSTGERGFLVIEKKTEGEKPEILIEHLYKTKSEAFWAGYTRITQYIEKRYEEYKESQKRKRKHKLSFDQWLTEQETQERQEKAGILTKAEMLSLEPGVKVRHPKFGVGSVVNIDGHHCIIDFESGRKTLVFEFSILRKYEE